MLLEKFEATGPIFEFKITKNGLGGVQIENFRVLEEISQPIGLAPINARNIKIRASGDGKACLRVLFHKPYPTNRIHKED